MTNGKAAPTLGAQRPPIFALGRTGSLCRGWNPAYCRFGLDAIGSGASVNRNSSMAIKKESRGDVGTYSPQPVARVRPLPTCTRCDPCGQLRAIVRLGSGLTANRENRPTPRDSILLSAGSRSPQPALRCQTLADPQNQPCDRSSDHA